MLHSKQNPGLASRAWILRTRALSSDLIRERGKADSFRIQNDALVEEAGPKLTVRDILDGQVVSDGYVAGIGDGLADGIELVLKPHCACEMWKLPCQLM